MQYAKLKRADLRGANLNGADLRKANFFGADLRNAKLEWTKLRGTNLSEANLTDAMIKFEINENLDIAILCKTKTSSGEQNSDCK